MPHTSSQPALHYTVTGAGPPLVLAHALGCDSGMWDGIIGPLSERHTVMRYDGRCHGQSDTVAEPFAIEDLVADLVRLLDDLRWPSASLVGLSMGGMVAMGLAIASPERVRKLVLANTTSRYPEAARPMWEERIRLAREEGMGAVADIASARLFSPAFAAASPHVVERYRSQLLSTDARAYAECCAAVARVDFDGALRNVQAQTLVIAGGADVAAPASMTGALASGIRGARHAVLEGAGHLSAVEGPAEFAALVRAFLDDDAAVTPSLPG